MGYTTDFQGQIDIDPPLSKKERDYLRKFSDSRHMLRKSGPYVTDSKAYVFAGPRDPDVVDYNTPPDCQPGLWCQWVPNEDGSALLWDGNEKFYEAERWMSYLRTHFVSLGAAKAIAPGELPFLKPHRMSGEILAVGEDAGSDVWKLTVDDRGVFRSQGTWSAEAEARVSGDEDEEDRYFGSAEAFGLIADLPGAIEFGEPVLIPNFQIAEQAALVQAHEDKASLERATPKRPARTAGSIPRI